MANERSWQLRLVYDTRHWRQLREIRLSLDPLCVDCLANGFTVAASVVDHIVPLVECGMERAFDLSNTRSLCKPCHDARTGAWHARRRYRRKRWRREERKWRELLDQPI